MPGYRLFVDMQTIQNAFHPSDRGIPRYAREFGRVLLRRRPDTRLALSPFQPWPKSLHPELAAAPQLVLNTPRELRAALADGPLAYLVMSPFELSRPVHSVLPPHVLETGVPIVSVLYDLIPDVLGVYDDLEPLRGPYHLRRQSVSGHDLFLALSGHTRRDAVERLGLAPERVVVVGAGASEFFHARSRRPPSSIVRSALPAVTKPFVLTVTGYAPHKNTEVLIDAWARLPRAFRSAHQLVITCGIPDTGPTLWIERAREAGVDAEQIVYTGNVSDLVLRSLYQAAGLFVSPSLYEGFGLPALEAVRCGTPAVTSDASSLPEVLDYPPATFPPHDPDALAALVERAFGDERFRGDLVAAGARAAARHTWDGVVDRSLDALTLLPPARASRRSAPLRLALVGPLPPSPSNASALIAQVADELAGHALVDCFVEPISGPAPRAPRRYRRFPAAALGVTFDPAGYDAVIYVVADTPDHAETYRLACAYPGVVWFHDLNLAELQLARAWDGRDRRSARAFMGDLLDRLDYARPSVSGAGDTVLDPDTYRAAEILLTRELVGTARGCVVDSAAGRTALEIDAGAGVSMPRTSVLQSPNLPEPSAADVARTLVEVAGMVAAGPRDVAPPFERASA